MSKKERIVSSLEQLSDLCFTISGLVIDDSSEGVAQPATSALSPAAPVFKPAGKETSTPENKGSLPSDSSEALEDWESVPELPSVSRDTPPTFSQVVGSSRSVFVTPVRRVVRAQSVDSVTSGVGMAGRGDGGRGVGGNAGRGAGVAAPAVPPAHPPAPNYATCTVAQFDAYWTAVGRDRDAQIAAEDAALAQSPDADVKVSALMKRDARREARMNALVNQMQTAQATANAAVAVNAARQAPPAKFEHKEKDPDIRQWIPLVEDYLRLTAPADYLSYASSYLAGKPRVYFMGQYDAYRAAHANADPPDVRAFFRETMIRGYGLRDPIQSYWDTWNKLSQGSGSVDEYNVAFEQAMVNLGDQLEGEQIKIEHYKAGLQKDIREMCRTSPMGVRWNNLTDVMTYATLQWPIVSERIQKRKASQPAKSASGKRKSTGSSPGRSSRARLSAAMTDEQRDYNMRHRLCHKCGKPGHLARDCTEQKSAQNKAKAGGKSEKQKDF